MVIKLTNVSKSFKHNKILNNINLEIEEGKTVGIIGANGSGKSVLFKLIIGLIAPDTGSVVVNGVEISGKGKFPEDIGVLINTPGLIENYTGFENLKYLAEIQKKINDEDIRKCMEMLNLDPNNKTKVKNYSLGMKQKLGIAQAIMENQKIVILDEAFNGLDFNTRNDVTNTIKKLKQEKKTVLLTGHYFQDIEELCDEMYLINNSEISVVTEDIKKAYRNNG